jgi:hypothetical protein
MFSIFSRARKAITPFLVGLSAFILVSCGATVPGGPRINTSAPVPVALLVPGGSTDSGDVLLAQSLENAARLAMTDLQGITIDLRVYNTAGQSDVAANAAIQAANDGAKIIIGPVFAEAANAAGRAVASRGINVLAFSNNPAIAGGNVFVLGPTFFNSADRLVQYAISQGRSSFHIVYANDPSEVAGRNAIGDAIAIHGGLVAGTTTFELTQQGVVDAIPQIISDIELSGADTVFLTSGTSGALPFLAQLLPEAGLDPAETQYVGLQRWDIPASAMTLPGLQGGWFARPDPGLATLFAERYTAAYGSAPHPIAGLAYDGIAAIGALVSQGKSDALTGQALTQPAGFAGVNGVFRLLTDGTNERGLTVSQILDGQVLVLDAAPRGFGQAGF